MNHCVNRWHDEDTFCPSCSRLCQFCDEFWHSIDEEWCFMCDSILNKVEVPYDEGQTDRNLQVHSQSSLPA